MLKQLPIFIAMELKIVFDYRITKIIYLCKKNMLNLNELNIIVRN